MVVLALVFNIYETIKYFHLKKVPLITALIDTIIHFNLLRPPICCIYICERDAKIFLLLLLTSSFHAILLQGLRITEELIMKEFSYYINITIVI